MNSVHVPTPAQHMHDPSHSHYLNQVQSVTNAGKSYMAARNRVVARDPLLSDSSSHSQYLVSMGAAPLQTESLNEDFDESGGALEYCPINMPEQTEQHIRQRYKRERNEVYDESILDILNESLGHIHSDEN